MFFLNLKMIIFDMCLTVIKKTCKGGDLKN